MIQRQIFEIRIAASIMPPVTESELRAAILRLAVEKESEHGMGYLAVHVEEISEPIPVMP